MSLLPLAEHVRPRIDVSRPVTTESRSEFLAIAHLRQWCHDTVACPMCQASDRAWDSGVKAGRAAAIRQIAEGR